MLAKIDSQHKLCGNKICQHQICMLKDQTLLITKIDSLEQMLYSIDSFMFIGLHSDYYSYNCLIGPFKH